MSNDRIDFHCNRLIKSLQSPASTSASNSKELESEEDMNLLKAQMDKAQGKICTIALFIVKKTQVLIHVRLLLI